MSISFLLKDPIYKDILSLNISRDQCLKMAKLVDLISPLEKRLCNNENTGFYNHNIHFLRLFIHLTITGIKKKL